MLNQSAMNTMQAVKSSDEFMWSMIEGKELLKGMSPVQYEGTEKLAFFINKFIIEKNKALFVKF